MARAIKMKLIKPQGEYDPTRSKFYGDPAIPLWMEEKIEDDEVFLAQIRLADIAAQDTENVLPHEGWLYFFIRAEDGSAWTPKEAVVRYSKEEPGMVLVDFNADSVIPQGLNETWLIDFELAQEENGSGMKLLGEPYDWNYADPAPRLLLQYDPLATEGIGFMDVVDGFGFFFFAEDSDNFDKVTFQAEHS